MPFGSRNPFEEIESLLDRMGRELDPDDWHVASGVAVDVADHGDRYVVTADLPGYEKDDLDVHLTGDTLAIAAEAESESTDEDVDYLRRERTSRSVSRRVRLPDPVDEEDIAARYHHGVLTVELPKRAVDEGTAIDIE